MSVIQRERGLSGGDAGPAPESPGLPASAPALWPCPNPEPGAMGKGGETLAGRACTPQGPPTASALPRAWERRPLLLPSPRGLGGHGAGGGKLWERAESPGALTGSLRLLAPDKDFVPPLSSPWEQGQS